MQGASRNSRTPKWAPWRWTAGNWALFAATLLLLVSVRELDFSSALIIAGAAYFTATLYG